MMLENAKFHHLGMAVSSVELATPFYASMGYSVSEPVIEPIQKVRVAYARKEGFPTVELLEPTDETSPAAKVIARNGCSPYHVCYEVPDIKAAVAEMRKEGGFMPLGRPIPGHGLDDALMVFCYNKDVGLIQIMETKKSE